MNTFLRLAPRLVDLAANNPESTAFIELRRTQSLTERGSFELKWDWTPLDKIAPSLQDAVIYAEDYHFFRHNGIDWAAIERAMRRNIRERAIVCGGSTMTQQLAKNLYLSPSRNIVRKFREAVISASLETHLSKKRILELYLNTAEWGTGVFGAEAAAHHWFGCAASELTVTQSVRLAVTLPSPLRREPNKDDPALTSDAHRVIKMMRRDGIVTGEQYRAVSLDLGVPHDTPFPARPMPPDLTSVLKRVLRRQPLQTYPSVSLSVADQERLDHIDPV